LSFSNEITFATRAISELTMPFVTFEPRNKAMISTPGTLWPSAWSFLFFHVVLRGCPHVTVRAVHALSNVGYGMIFRDVALGGNIAVKATKAPPTNQLSTGEGLGKQTLLLHYFPSQNILQYNNTPS
jgi:hypothetical protein